jgi:mono/diheme cytochrome c family protein
MSGLRKLIVLAVVLLAIAGLGWLALRSGDPTAFAKGARVELADYKGPNPTGASPSLAGADLVARGEYLTRAADCAACHSAPGGKPFSGGLAFQLPMIGTLYSTNITPDAETGIGAWSDDEFVRALHEGIGKDGKHLYPAFPYTSYALMTRSDALAVKTYLFNLKPVKYTPPPNDIGFPFNQRYLMWFWNVLFKPAHRFEPNSDQSAEWNRGGYLVEALGHCGDCHTPRNILFGLKSHQKFAGAIIQGWKAYNITPDPKWGIGAWSDSQIGDYLAHGHADGRSSAGGPMAEVVDNSLRFLSQDDIGAVAAYLKSVPPRGDNGNVAAAETPSAQEQSPKEIHLGSGGDSLGLRVFEGACAGCHEFDGSGAVSNYAALLGTRTVNDPAGTNATQALLQGTYLHAALGKVFMPGFGDGYSDAEIAAVVNFVTGRFGTSASALTPNEVAKRRQAN